MKILLDDIDALKIPIQTIQKKIDEIPIKIEPSGLKISTLDRNHIIFYELNIPENVFTQYNIIIPDNEENITFTVPTKELTTILGKAKKEDTLELEYKEKLHRLQIQILNYTTKVQKKYNIQTMDTEDNIPGYPKIQREVTLTLPSKELKQYIQDITLGSSQKIQLKTIETDLLIRAMSEFESNEIIIPIENEQKITQALYAYEYVQSMVQSQNYSEEVQLCFSNDMPLEIEYQHHECIFKMMLAPRIEEDE